MAGIKNGLQHYINVTNDQMEELQAKKNIAFTKYGNIDCQNNQSRRSYI